MSAPVLEGALVTRQDLRRVRGQAAALLGLAERASTAEREEIGVTSADIDELRAALGADAALAVPSASATYLAAYGLELTKEAVLRLYHRTLLAAHALAPIVMYRLARKMDDAKAPGSTRVLLEMAKGLGLLAPAEPVSAPKRIANLDLDELRKVPLDALKDDVLRRSA